MGPETAAAAVSAFVMAYVLGSTSAKIRTSSVIIRVASATPLSPNTRVSKAVASEVARMLTRLLPRRTDPISRSLSSVMASARSAPWLPLSACARSLPREAAVSAVSEPEKKPDSTSRSTIPPDVTQKAVSTGFKSLNNPVLAMKCVCRENQGLGRLFAFSCCDLER